MELRANFHTHTTFCDGSDTAEEMAREAARLNFSALGFSGHMDSDNWMDYTAYDAEIYRLQEAYRGTLTILRGVELDNVFDPSCAPAAEYRIGSTHFVPAPGHPVWERTLSDRSEAAGNDGLVCVDDTPEVLQRGCERFYGGDYYALAEAYYRFEALVAERTKPAFVGHFDLVTRFNDLLAEDGGGFLDESDERYLAPALTAMETLVRSHIPFEINCGAINRGRKREPYPCGRLLRALHEMGGELVISSDAHEKRLLAGGFPEAIALARACGFTHVNILTRENTGIPAKNTRQDPRLADGQTETPLFWKRQPL